MKITLEHKNLLKSSFTEDEIKSVITSLNNNKVSGEDKFPAEFYKALQSALIFKFTVICNKILSDGIILHTQTQANIITIPKAKIPNPLSLTIRLHS